MRSDSCARHSWATLIVLLYGLLPASGQETIEARLRFISTDRPLMGVGIVSSLQPLGLVITPDNFSQEITYRGPARLTLVPMTAQVTKPVEEPASKSDNDPADKAAVDKEKRLSPLRGRSEQSGGSKVTYQATGGPPLAWLDLPTKQGILHLIILVHPGKGNGMTPIVDRPGSFPPGSNRYLNLCPFPVTIKTPAGEKTIPGGASSAFRPGATDADYYDLQILGRERRLLFSPRVFHLESTRKLYLITPEGQSGAIRLKPVVDRPQPKEVQESPSPTAK
jgi:hypothetical protein